MHRNQDCNHYKSVIMKANATLNYLTAHNVKPSVQRMAVMEYLLDHRTHPTADEIYLALHRKMPTLLKNDRIQYAKNSHRQGGCLTAHH